MGFRDRKRKEIMKNRNYMQSASIPQNVRAHRWSEEDVFFFVLPGEGEARSVMSSLYVSCPVLFFKSGHSDATEFRALMPKGVVPRLDSPCASLKIRGSRERSFRGTVFRVCARRTEADSVERTQASMGEVNSPKDGGSSSGSFLSILCPLLKLFAVSLHLPVIFFR